MVYESKFLLSLALTVGVETGVLLVIARLISKKTFGHLSVLRLIGAGIFCSLATLPYLWFILPHWIKSYYTFMAVGELTVFSIETVLYVLILQFSLIFDWFGCFLRPNCSQL
jgi:hypothetical protein